MSDRRRLPTAFALWWQENKASVSKDGKNTIRAAGKMWPSLADQDKKKYQDMVEEKNERDMEVIEAFAPRKSLESLIGTPMDTGTVVHCEEVCEPELTVYSNFGCSRKFGHLCSIPFFERSTKGFLLSPLTPMMTIQPKRIKAWPWYARPRLSACMP